MARVRPRLRRRGFFYKAIPMIVEIDGHQIQIDDADLPILEGYRWRVKDFSARGYGPCMYVIGNHRVLLHRLLIGAIKGQFVDHANGDSLDNRRDNLRLCTHAQNMANRKMARHNRTGLKGVERKGNGWRARITKDGVRCHLGYFKTAAEAAAAFTEAARRLHGEFFRA